MPRARFKNLTGRTFGRWTIINQAPTSKHREIMWNCLCLCGTKKAIRGYTLQNGDSKSCGCLSRERTHIVRFIDLTGKTFGRLTAISRAPNDKRKNTMWNCKCICNIECIINGYDLRAGHTRSCGCLRTEIIKRNGSDHPNYGKRATEETKKKMAILRTGRMHNKESKRKMSLSQAGENHPNWKGGITPGYRRIRNLAKYKQWRSDVFARDNYTCQICDSRGGTINAHHIQSFADAIEYRFNVDNGKTLCGPCHRDLHKEIA